MQVKEATVKPTRGWLSLVNEIFWRPPRSVATSDDPPISQQRSSFFPFLRHVIGDEEKAVRATLEIPSAGHGRDTSNGNSKPSFSEGDEDASRAPATPTTPRSCNVSVEATAEHADSNNRNSDACGGRGPGGSGSGEVRRGLSRRRTRASSVSKVKEERSLQKDLPFIWTFLKDAEGWDFVGNSWDVRPPRVEETSTSLVGGWERRTLAQEQLSAFLVEHPELLKRYRQWRERMFRENRACVDGVRGSNRSTPRESDRSPSGVGSSRRRASPSPSTPHTPAPTPQLLPQPMKSLPPAAPDEEKKKVRGWQQQREPSGIGPLNSRTTSVSRTTPISASKGPRGRYGSDSPLRSEPSGIGSLNSRTTSVSRTTPISASKGPRGRYSSYSPLRSGSPALRTRSRSACVLASRCTSEQSVCLEGGLEAGRVKPTSVRESPVILISASGRGQIGVDGGGDRSIRTPLPTGRGRVGVSRGRVKKPEDSSERQLKHVQRELRSGGKKRKAPVVEVGRDCASPDPRAAATPAAASGAGRSSARQRAGGFVGGVRAKRRWCDVRRIKDHDNVRHDVNRTSNQDADPQQVHVEVACVQPPPSNGETPKVKTECEDQSSPLPSEAAATSKTSRLSCKKGMSLGGTPRPARRTIWERNTPRTPDRASARQAGAEGREDTDGGWGGGIGSDPLAPYDRIEEETVDDSGLKELLHTGRRDGYLDLRRYRKPGWPRPLRVTRVEASHGKRFEEHLLRLLKEDRRVEATVFLRRLAHFDRHPPHLVAVAENGGRGRWAASVPLWYQEVAGVGGGVEELVDLTLGEAEVVECLDNEPLDCVVMDVVKKEPEPCFAEIAGGIKGREPDRDDDVEPAGGGADQVTSSVGVGIAVLPVKTEVRWSHSRRRLELLESARQTESSIVS